MCACVCTHVNTYQVQWINAISVVRIQPIKSISSEYAIITEFSTLGVCVTHSLTLALSCMEFFHYHKYSMRTYMHTLMQRLLYVRTHAQTHTHIHTLAWTHLNFECQCLHEHTHKSMVSAFRRYYTMQLHESTCIFVEKQNSRNLLNQFFKTAHQILLSRIWFVLFTFLLLLLFFLRIIRCRNFGMLISIHFFFCRSVVCSILALFFVVVGLFLLPGVYFVLSFTISPFPLFCFALV